MKRTTVLLDDALWLEAQQAAKQRGTTFTALLDEALREHLRTQHAPRRFSFVGMGHTNQPTHAMRDGWDEAELRLGIDRKGGWLPQRAAAVEPEMANHDRPGRH